VKTRSRFVIASLLSLLASHGLWAAEEDSFAKANQAYSEGRYDEAAAGYQALVASGHWNANLFYNLGNARYRLGDFGQAILSYERALALEPRHPEADANLRLARDEGRALEVRKDPVERYAGFATVRQWSVAAAVAFWFALFVTAHLFFSGRRSARQVALVVLSVSLFCVSVSAIYTLEDGVRGAALAVVTGQDVEARVATADTSKSVLALPAGSEIKILSERGDWIYAALPNDQRGWIPTKSVERVRRQSS
jgi:tetratricopeptide (TPR) repeat protein